MLQFTGGNDENLEVSGSVRRPGMWKEVSFGDYICHTFQGGMFLRLVLKKFLSHFKLVKCDLKIYFLI